MVEIDHPKPPDGRKNNTSRGEGGRGNSGGGRGGMGGRGGAGYNKGRGYAAS